MKARALLVSTFFLVAALLAGADGAPSPAPSGADGAVPPAPLPTAPKETPELVAKGKTAFDAACAVCHGPLGAGDGPAAVALEPKPRNFAKDPFKQGAKVEEIFLTVTNGVKDTPMVGFAHLSEEDRWGIAYYVRTLLPKPEPKKKPAAPAPPSAAAAEQPR